MITKNLRFVIYTALGLLFSVYSMGQVNYLLDNDCATGQIVVFIVPDVNYPSTTDWNPAQFTIEVTSGSTTTLASMDLAGVPKTPVHLAVVFIRYIIMQVQISKPLQQVYPSKSRGLPFLEV